MPAPTPLTDTERQQIRNLHAQGLGCNAIARQLGRDRSTISRAANAMGLDFDRAQTRAATAAHVDDAKARRAQLANDLLADAERLRKQLWQPCVVHSFGGRDNVYNEHPVNEPPFRDKRDIMATVGLAIDKHAKLVDIDHSGAEDGRGMLGALAAGLQAAYEQLGPDES